MIKLKEDSKINRKIRPFKPEESVLLTRTEPKLNGSISRRHSGFMAVLVFN
jgi:hypothetical protein